MAEGFKGMSHSLWVFTVEGGERFQTTVEGNPSITHDGGTSVFHLMLEEQDAHQLVSLVEGIGCRISMRPARRQTAEQEAERTALLGVGKEEAVWPCPSCPTCYWFDPVALQVDGSGEPCGAKGWPEEMRRVSLESNKAVEDLEACPLTKEDD